MISIYHQKFIFRHLMFFYFNLKISEKKIKKNIKKVVSKNDQNQYLLFSNLS